MRAAISIQKLTDAAESSWQMPNRTITPRSSRFGGTFVTQSISGSDRIMTAHAYTEMSMPAADSVMLKSAAMSVSRPMGMNSDVLNTKVESVIPTSGTQNLIDTSTHFLSEGVPKTSIFTKPTQLTPSTEQVCIFFLWRRERRYYRAALFLEAHHLHGGTTGMDGEFLSILGTMVILFFDISIGYIAKKAHVMDKAIDKGLSKLILNTALPAMILGSVLTADSLPESTEILITMGLSIISFAIMTALAFLVTKLLGVRDGHRGVFRFMLTFGNVGFIGFPVLSAIFGPSTLIYGSIFNLPFNFLVFTMGVWFIAQDSGRGAKVKMGLKTFLTPANIACAIAIVLTLLNVHSVPIIGDAAKTLGSFTTPGALLIIGSSLADLPVSKLIGGPRLWIASLARLIVSPLIVWALFRLVPVDPMLIDIMVVLCAMPVATNGTMLCYQYGGDSRTMAQGTFVTTVLSIITIPILVMVIG